MKTLFSDDGYGGFFGTPQFLGFKRRSFVNDTTGGGGLGKKTVAGSVPAFIPSLKSGGEQNA